MRPIDNRQFFRSKLARSSLLYFPPHLPSCKSHLLHRAQRMVQCPVAISASDLKLRPPSAQFSIIEQKIGSPCPTQPPCPRKLAVPDGLMSTTALSKGYSFLYSQEFCMYSVRENREISLRTTCYGTEGWFR